jgi:hypothetical protein
MHAKIGIFVAYLHSHIDLSNYLEIVRVCMQRRTIDNILNSINQAVCAPSTLLSTLITKVFCEIFRKNLSLSHIYYKKFPFKNI